MHDGVDGVCGQQPRHGVPVRHVAGGDGHPRAQTDEFAPQVVRAGRVRTPTAGQHQLPGTARDGPAGDAGPESTGAAGDQDALRSRPRAGGAGGGSGRQTAGVRVGSAYGDLVLVAGGEHGDGPREGTSVRPDGQVEQSAPHVGVFERGDPAQSPHGGPSGIDGGLGAAAHGDGTAGHEPQRRGDRRVAVCLHEGEGALRTGQAGQHAGDRRPVGDGRGEHLAQAGAPEVGADHAFESRQELLDAGEDGAAVGGGVGAGVGSGVGLQQQPPPVGRAGLGRCEPLPADPIAPGVRGGPLRLGTPPRGQRGHDALQFGAVEVQHTGQLFGVTTVHGLPERGLPGRRRGAVPVPVPVTPRRGSGQYRCAGRRTWAGRTAGRTAPSTALQSDRYSGGVQCGQRGGQRLGLGPVLALDGYADRVVDGHRARPAPWR